MPGDNVTCTFELITPVVEQGLRFALREGGEPSAQAFLGFGLIRTTHCLSCAHAGRSLRVCLCYIKIFGLLSKSSSRFSFCSTYSPLLLLLLLLTLQKQRVISDRRNHRLCSHPSSLAPRASSLSPTLSGSSCSPLFSCGTPPCFFSFGLRRLGC